MTNITDVATHATNDVSAWRDETERWLESYYAQQNIIAALNPFGDKRYAADAHDELARVADNLACATDALLTALASED